MNYNPWSILWRATLILVAWVVAILLIAVWSSWQVAIGVFLAISLNNYERSGNAYNP